MSDASKPLAIALEQNMAKVAELTAQLATMTRENEALDRQLQDTQADYGSMEDRAERAEAALQQARELLLSQSATRHPVFGIYGEARPCACVNCEDIRAFLAPEPPTREGTALHFVTRITPTPEMRDGKPYCPGCDGGCKLCRPCGTCAGTGTARWLLSGVLTDKTCGVCDGSGVAIPAPAIPAAAPQGEPALFKNACPSCSHFSAMDGSGGHRCMDCECRDDYHRLSGGPTPAGGAPGREG